MMHFLPCLSLAIMQTADKSLLLSDLGTNGRAARPLEAYLDFMSAQADIVAAYAASRRGFNRQLDGRDAADVPYSRQRRLTICHAPQLADQPCVTLLTSLQTTSTGTQT